uniref:Uncharacterized protein n=1 Tax=Anguilla anguilla TaxID=7936 RepID=A0A0E9PGF5_ANGAN
MKHQRTRRGLNTDKMAADPTQGLEILSFSSRI